jgi:hypothetical protein
LDRSPLSEFLARGKESILSWGCFYDYLSLCSFQRTIFSNPSPNYDTVSQGEETEREAKSLGAIDFLMKPLNIVEVERIASQVLS